jgi:hypothetical protein
MKLTFIAPARPGQKAQAKSPQLTLSLLGGRIGFNAAAASLLDLTAHPHIAVARDEEENLYLVGLPAEAEGTVTVQVKNKSVFVSHSAAVRQIVATLPARTFAEAASVALPLALEPTLVPNCENARVLGLLTGGAKVLRLQKGKGVARV